MFGRLVAIFPLLFPLYLFRGELLGIPVTLVEVLLAFGFVFFVLCEEVWRVTWWKKHWHLYRNWGLWLFLAAAFVGVLVAPDVSYMVNGHEFPAKITALGILKGWILAPMAYFFMAKFYFHDRPSLIRLALRALLLGGVFLSLQAMAQVVTGDFSTPDARASGPFESANYLALYLGPIVVYGFLALARAKSWGWRALLSASLLICTAALYATLSYAAWIAVLAALLVALLVHARKLPKRVRFGLLAGAFTLGALALVSQLGSEKFTQFLEFSERSSTSVRLQIYEISLSLIKDNAIFGIGLGQFEQFYQVNAVEVLGQDPFEWNMLHPHNIFLAFWLSMGLFGLVAFVWLCFKALTWIWEQDKHEKRIAAVMLVAILVHGMFDVPYFKNDLAFQFWLLLAVLL
jgi:O-antigen ligase